MFEALGDLESKTTPIPSHLWVVFRRQGIEIRSDLY
jgi:hypothetical protein